jgi:hypothetical protein
MKKSMLMSLLVATATATTSFGQIQLYAAMDGLQEVPPTPSAATGVGRATFNENGTVTYHVIATGLTGTATAAHIHQAAAGANGGVIVGLTQIPGTPEWKGTSGVLTAAQRTALLTDGCYFNVHTSTFAGGEIRGQILGVRRSRFVATLDEAQETPPTGVIGTGFGELWLTEPENVVTYDVVTSNLTGASLGHVHSGAVGVAGPVIFTLNGSGHFCGAATMSAADVATLKAGGTYFNVHTLAFPGGEIRGQILPANEHFTVFCNGPQETPPTPSVHTACGTFVLNAPANTLTYSIVTTLPAITAMHLHTGAVGQSGGVAIGIGGSAPVITGTTAALTATQLANLRRGNLYLNLHTTAFPGGEVRGNVRPSADPFGFGSPDSSGGPPRIGGSGYFGQGAPFEVRVFDAAPTSNILLFVGLSTTFWPSQGVGLPFDASVFAPCAYVWTDWDLTVFLPGVTDAEGCAQFPITLPVNPFFDCLRLCFQGFISDPNANAFGFVVSDALHVRVAHTTLAF